MVPRTGDGLARMRGLAAELPEQLRRGFRSAAELGFSISEGIRRVAVVGMGGSAIGSDVLRTLTDSETDLVLRTVREPALPRWVDRTTLVVAVSYSGDTWETLAAFDEAARRGAPRLALSSGGRLAIKARAEGVLRLAVPPGLPPRAALGYLFGGLLGLFDEAFSPSNRTRVDRISRLLHRQTRRLRSPGAGPARLAARIGTRLPWISAARELSPVARRWATQIEENAKRLAHWDTLPELLHNAVVAWDALPRAEARQYFVVRLESAGDDGPMRERMAYLARILDDHRVPTASVRFAAEDRLERLLGAVQWGDYVSLALAARAGADPYQTVAIRRMKRALERPARRRGHRSA